MNPQYKDKQIQNLKYNFLYLYKISNQIKQLTMLQPNHQQIHKLFSQLKCPQHNSSAILQLCISTQCQSQTRLCCLQCVDQHHMGTEHILISTIKFTNLLCEFHLIREQKQTLNKQLLTGLNNQQQQLNGTIEKYYKYIAQSLTKENQLTSYQEIIGLGKIQQVDKSQLQRKLNEIVDCHVWMLETNCKAKNVHHHSTNNNNNDKKEEQHEQRLIKNLQQKYYRLQKRLKQINSTCEQEIKEIISRRTTEVKKLFHLFDEIKYNLQDDGRQLDDLTHSMSKIKVDHSLINSVDEKLIQQEEKEVKQVFDFMGNVAGGQ